MMGAGLADLYGLSQEYNAQMQRDMYNRQRMQGLGGIGSYDALSDARARLGCVDSLPTVNPRKKKTIRDELQSDTDKWLKDVLA